VHQNVHQTCASVGIFNLSEELTDLIKMERKVERDINFLFLNTAIEYDIDINICTPGLKNNIYSDSCWAKLICAETFWRHDITV
jgi:hypothetical protein